MKQLRLLTSICFAFGLCNLIAEPSFAQYILPGTADGRATSGITVNKPANTSSGNLSRTGDAGSAYIDDVFLTSMTFGSTTFVSGDGQFRGVGNVNVVSGAGNVNAEYGDEDTGSDGNPNPFVLAGVSSADTQSTDPAIQRPSIRAAFNSLSLVQGIDGEGAPYVLDLIFQRGINDNNAAASDLVPELVFFERGINSTYQVQVITGGTFLSPIFAPVAVTINSGNNAQARRTGIFIDTVEIPTEQQLGVTGLDLNAFFGGGTVTTIYGVRITDTLNSGTDLYGNFLSAASTSQFVPVPDALRGDGFLAEPIVVPESGTGLLTLLGGAGVLGAVVLRRTRRTVK